jgi:hypothetical protein
MPRMMAETALRLGKALGTTADFWMNLQCKYDLETALEEMGSRIEREVLPIKEQEYSLPENNLASSPGCFFYWHEQKIVSRSEEIATTQQS